MLQDVVNNMAKQASSQNLQWVSIYDAKKDVLHCFSEKFGAPLSMHMKEKLYMLQQQL
eukprot:c27380_g1_i1 orf=208-381(-)